METLAKGQRLPLANLVPDGVLQIGVAAQGLALDVACFGLDAAGKLSDERYMTFFNQPRTPCGGVEARAGSGGDMFEERPDRRVAAQTLDRDAIATGRRQHGIR